MEIIIHGLKYSVKFENPGAWERSGMGRTSIKTNEILINRTMPQDTMASTLLHEMIHVFLDANGFLSESSDEKLVSTIANSLFSTIVSNPVVFRQIIETGGIYEN